MDEYAERDVLAKASMEQPDGIFYIIYAGSAMREGKDKCQGTSYTAGGMGRHRPGHGRGRPASGTARI